MKKCLLLTAICVCFCTDLFAFNLISPGTITSISNSTSAGTNFVVSVSGTGPCNGTNIIFDEANANSPEAFRRSFALATLAFSLQYNVEIFGKITDDCTSASFIRVIF